MPHHYIKQEKAQTLHERKTWHKMPILSIMPHDPSGGLIEKYNLKYPFSP